MVARQRFDAARVEALPPRTHLSPFSFGHLELLRRDNRPAVNHLPVLLGRPPRPVGVAAHEVALPETREAAVAPANGT